MDYSAEGARRDSPALLHHASAEKSEAHRRVPVCRTGADRFVLKLIQREMRPLLRDSHGQRQKCQSCKTLRWLRCSGICGFAESCPHGGREGISTGLETTATRSAETWACEPGSPIPGWRPMGGRILSCSDRLPTRRGTSECRLLWSRTSSCPAEWSMSSLQPREVD